MSHGPDDKPKHGSELAEEWESPAEEPAEATLAPSPELEEALREAAEAVEAREAARKDTPAEGEAPSEGEAPREGEPAAEPEPDAETLRAELEKLQQRYVRLNADYENQRRRSLKERHEAHQYGHENLVKDLLGTVDNLERAIEHASQSDSGDFESMLQGVELVRRELLGSLARHGVSVIEAEGEVFDPNVHEAMAQEEDATVPEGTVLRVFQKGYRLRDRLLRPARVMVSKRTNGKNADDRREGGSEEADE